MKDYYKVLGVPPDATIEEIKKQRNRLLKKWHPDYVYRQKDLVATATERVKEINEAWEILGDPVKRAKYDRMMAAFGLFYTSQWTRSSEREQPNHGVTSRQKRHTHTNKRKNSNECVDEKEKSTCEKGEEGKPSSTENESNSAAKDRPAKGARSKRSTFFISLKWYLTPRAFRFS